MEEIHSFAQRCAVRSNTAETFDSNAAKKRKGQPTTIRIRNCAKVFPVLFVHSFSSPSYPTVPLCLPPSHSSLTCLSTFLSRFSLLFQPVSFIHLFPSPFQHSLLSATTRHPFILAHQLRLFFPSNLSAWAPCIKTSIPTLQVTRLLQIIPASPDHFP